MRRSLPLLLSILSSVFGGQNNTKVGAEGGAGGGGGGGRVGLPINILLSKITYKQTVDTEEERRGLIINLCNSGRV